MNKKILIEGMTCEHCVKRVENAIKEVEGVKSVKVNLKEKYANVDFSKKVDNAKLINAIDEVGYNVIGIEE